MALNDLSGEILRLEERRIAAMRSKDCDALEGLLAEGLVYIHYWQRRRQAGVYRFLEERPCALLHRVRPNGGRDQGIRERDRLGLRQGEDRRRAQWRAQSIRQPDSNDLGALRGRLEVDCLAIDAVAGGHGA